MCEVTLDSLRHKFATCLWSCSVLDQELDLRYFEVKEGQLIMLYVLDTQEAFFSVYLESKVASAKNNTKRRVEEILLELSKVSPEVIAR